MISMTYTDLRNCFDLTSPP